MHHDPIGWKRDYEASGYLVVPDLVDPETLTRLRDGVDAITSKPRDLPEHLARHIVFEQDYVRTHRQYNQRAPEELGDAIRVIMELPLFDPVFAEMIHFDPLLDVLQALFGTTEFHFHNYKCIVKSPLVSSTFCWHRDLPYLNHSTPDLITAMLCLDDMTEENGATVVLPGTHRIRHDQFRADDTDIPEERLPDTERVSVCCPAGSAVLFHVNIIHGGGPNVSPRPRRNVIGIWAGPDTHPVRPQRYVYQDVRPRSVDPARRKQMLMTFPALATTTATV